MDLKVFFTVFGAVFIAELGNKTQPATMLFAADKQVSKLVVFVGAFLALIVASGLGVLADGIISQYASEKYLHYVAGVGVHDYWFVDASSSIGGVFHDNLLQRISLLFMLF